MKVPATYGIHRPGSLDISIRHAGKKSFDVTTPDLLELVSDKNWRTQRTIYQATPSNRPVFCGLSYQQDTLINSLI